MFLVRNPGAGRLCSSIFGTPNMGPKNGACPNTGITCDLQHSCCIDCVRANVTPVPKCSPKCLGLRYTCPLCDAPHCVSPFHALTLIKGNWVAANECFT